MGSINHCSPLRYPGGKAAMTDYFIKILTINGIGNDGIYCEPFAGGAGVALTLLLDGHVSSIIINDVDPCIAAFWASFLDDPDRFLARLARCEISIHSWRRHRSTYDKAPLMDLTDKNERFKLGFSTFFLNRANRGGILPHAGPIGGQKQDGAYRLDARFKKDALATRLRRIAAFKDKITFKSKDALEFIRELPQYGLPKEKVFMYLDPPYYHKGNELYLNFYEHKDHVTLFEAMKEFNFCKWLMTYDNCVQIKEIYNDEIFCLHDFSIQYSIQKIRKANEILIAPCTTKLPQYKGTSDA